MSTFILWVPTESYRITRKIKHWGEKYLYENRSTNIGIIYCFPGYERSLADSGLNRGHNGMFQFDYWFKKLQMVWSLSNQMSFN